MLKWIFLILGSLSLFVANVTVWFDQTITDSSRFAETTSDVLNQPEVEARIAQVMAQYVMENTEIPQRVREGLPEQLVFAAPLANRQVQGLIESLSEEILGTDAVSSASRALIQRFHARVLAILEDDERLLQAEGDSLVLDLRVPLRQIFERLDIQPPPSFESSPQTQVVLVSDSSGLQVASAVVRNSTEVAIGASVLTFVLMAAVVMTAPSRQRGFILVSYALLVVGVLTLVLLLVSNMLLENAAQERTVLRELIRGLESSLRLQSFLLIILGAGMLLVSSRQGQRMLSSAHGLLKGTTNRAEVGPMIAGAAVVFVVVLAVAGIQ